MDSTVIVVISVGVALAALIASFGGLILHGQRAMRQEFRQEIAALRQEFKQDLAALRQEVKQEIASLRQEFKQDLDALRQEFKQDLDALRQEFKKEIGSVLEKLDVLRREVHDLSGRVARLEGAFPFIVQLRPVTVREGEQADRLPEGSVSGS